MGEATGTRERLLEIAERAVLAKGFGATSIEELAAEAGISRNGFFYHFPDKNHLARALLKRHLDREEAFYDDVFARARELAGDPLHACLVGLKLFAEAVAEMDGGRPSCMVATVTYQERLFDAQVRELNRDIVLCWRRRFRAMFEEIAALYPPRTEIDLDALADMVNGVVEGGMVIGRATEDGRVLAAQIMTLRSLLRLLFLPQP